MSRSKKSEPYHDLCGCKRKFKKEYKKWRNKQQRLLLKDLDDIPNLNWYKRITRWDFGPADGRVYDPGWPKSYRK